jgi:DNA-binding SARP family transcriptional activator
MTTPENTPPRIHVRVLGHIEVLIDDRPVQLSPTLRSVVGLLAIGRGRLVSVPTMLAGLWEGTTVPGNGAKTLLSHIARLRALLGEGAILRAEFGYRFDLAQVDIDVVTFESRAKSAELAFAAMDNPAVVRMASLVRSMWKGAPLQGASVEFALDECAALFETRARVEELRVIAMIEQRRSSEVVADLETLVAEDPNRELWWVYLMATLQATGRSVDALRAFSRLRRFLAESDGVEPGTEVQWAEGCVLRNETIVLANG